MEDMKVVQSVEVIDLINFINRKKKLHQKMLLDSVELVLDTNTEEYKTIRKAILDNTNDFSRSVVRVIFGDTFEGYIK
jgi:hypothetical protein